MNTIRSDQGEELSSLRDDPNLATVVGEAGVTATFDIGELCASITNESSNNGNGNGGSREGLSFDGSGKEEDSTQIIKERFANEFKLQVVEFVERTSSNNVAPTPTPRQIGDSGKQKDEIEDPENLARERGFRRSKGEESQSANEVDDDYNEGSDRGGEDEEDHEQDNDDPAIKISPSDLEMDEGSNLEQDGFFDPDVFIKEEPESSDADANYSESSLTSEEEEDEMEEEDEDDDDEFRPKRRRKVYTTGTDTEYESTGTGGGRGSRSSNRKAVGKSEPETDGGMGTDTDGEGVKKTRPTRTARKRKVPSRTESGRKKRGTTKKTTTLPKPKPAKPKERKKRGRPKAPRRLDGTDALTSDDEEDTTLGLNIPIKTGSGYHIEFKMRVLKYAETHSNSATAEKFGVNAKRIREWKRAKDKLGLEKDGLLKRRPRNAGFTVQEKLQAVQFAKERSTDEARLLYGVDRRTIEKWRANQAKLEARLQSGQGDALRDGTAGRKPRFTHIEDQLRDWVVALRLKGVTVNCRMILNKAAKLLAEDASMRGEPQQQVKAPRTWSWVIGFLKRQNLMGLLGTTLGHEDPRELLSVELKTNQGQNLAALAQKPVEIPENPNKRHRRSISLQDKVNIINRIEKGETQGVVAKSLGVATSTVQTIWSCRHDILRRYLNPKAKPKSGAILWKKYNVIANALIDWYEQCLVKGTNIDGKALFDKSIQLSETYRLSEDFKLDAREWYKQFCKRHKLMDKCNQVFAPNANSSQNVTSNEKVFSVPQTQSDSFDQSASASAAEDYHHAEHDIDDFLSNLRTTNANPSFEQKVSTLQTSTGQPNLALVNYSTTPPTTASNSQPQAQFNSLFGATISTPTTSCFNTNPPTTITITDALKYLSLVRSWIVANYGPNDANLNNHLSSIENAIFKKRPT